MAATTVDDTINGRPLVLQSFADKANTAHVTVPWAAANAQRGKDKMEVFRTLLASHGGLQGEALEQTAQRLLEHLTAQLLRNVERLREMLRRYYRFSLPQAARGVFIALGQRFPRWMAAGYCRPFRLDDVRSGGLHHVWRRLAPVDRASAYAPSCLAGGWPAPTRESSGSGAARFCVWPGAGRWETPRKMWLRDATGS